MNNILFKISSLGGLLICISTIYVHSYWTSFSVNAMPYIGISEFVLYSFSPLLNSSLTYIISSVVMVVLLNNNWLPFGGFLQAISNQPNKGKLIRRRNIIGVIVVAFHIVLLIILFVKDVGSFYFLLPFTGAMFSVFINNFLLSNNILQSSGFDLKIIPIYTLLIISSFTVPKGEVELIKSHKKFTYVEYQEEIYKYLNKAGEYHFLLAMDGQPIRVVHKDKLKDLKLYLYNENPKTEMDSVVFKKILSIKQD